jgi:hypothetical protein
MTKQIVAIKLRTVWGSTVVGGHSALGSKWPEHILSADNSCRKQVLDRPELTRCGATSSYSSCAASPSLGTFASMSEASMKYSIECKCICVV